MLPASLEDDDVRSADSSPEQAEGRLPAPPSMPSQQQQQSPAAQQQRRARTPAEAELRRPGCSPVAAGAGQEQQPQRRDSGPLPTSPGPGATAAPPPAALEVDRTQRVRAVLGVRLVWVSVEARRRGVATRLLDCARSGAVRGYVVPRHELAFTQPSEDGCALIEAYTSSRRFLVY